MRKKKHFRADEVALGDSDTDALLYKRDGWWQLRIYLREEGKYWRRTLKTKSLEIAKEKGKELWRKIERDRLVGRKQFGLTIVQGIDKYLEARREEVTEIEAGGITAERYMTIASQLKQFKMYMTKDNVDAQLRDIQKRDTWNYFEWRRSTAKKEPATSTLINEQAIINSCMRYLFEQLEVNIPALEFPKIRLLERNDSQRTTPTKSQYGWMLSEIDRRTKAKGEMLTDAERLKRKLFECYFLISAKTGLRSGEQYKLRWENVKTYYKRNKHMAQIRVLATTTKVRKERIFVAVCGDIFERLRGFTHEEGYVFSVNGGKTHIERTWLNRGWNEMLADISDERISAEKKAQLVPYSLRHWFITQHINAGAEVSQVAALCGTSVMQINKTYYHLQKEEQERVVMLGMSDYVDVDDWENDDPLEYTE